MTLWYSCDLFVDKLFSFCGGPVTPNSVRLFFAVAALSVVTLAQPAYAQNNVLDLRLVEFDTEPDVTYQNFIYDRFFKDGKIIFEALHLRIAPIEYKEFSVGAGYRFLERGDYQFYGLAHMGFGSDPVTGDSTYFQPAVLLLDAKGKWTGSFFGQLYEPVDDEGVRAWLIDPFELQYNVGGPVSLGVSSYMYNPTGDGGPALKKIGPKVSVADKFGATEFRVTRSYFDTESGWEMQFRRVFVF